MTQPPPPKALRGESDGRKRLVVTRRTLLKATGVGAAAVILSQLDAETHGPPLPAGLLALSMREGALVEAIGARIWPGDASDPGAREAGTVHYVDRALAAPLAVYLPVYRLALQQLDAAARKEHRMGFVELPEPKQDALLTAMSAGTLAGVKNGQSFFAVIRTHTLEGLFSDPIHGGNRNMVGWKSVGYPGPFYIIGAHEQQRSADTELPYQSLDDL